ncbi:AraC-like DNA-binding protein [Chitinophaga skermanii]|uniref:AraC-like DNA-binding protein n=1 Tax=Chitinophaga skermanii TaxID=331697 RepID=A0A327QQQ5_9BACT|nr:AraC family transcriptional regulator [Chitinophaga skermanii]RAJ06581.1 AraC-like DNA-binding protein [Chitinophaga skermanii]
MQKGKKTIPVYDICALNGADYLLGSVAAEPFAKYVADHPTLHWPHRHSFYHMVLFTEGKGHFTIDFERFEVKPGTIYCMAPAQVHGWEFEGNVDGYVVNFSEDFFRHYLVDADYLERFPFFNGNAQDGVLQLSVAGAKQIAQVFEQVIAEVHSKNVLGIDLIRSYLQTLFALLGREAFTVKGYHPLQHQNQVVVENFRKLVNRHYQQYKLPKDYASLLYITPNHLNALCKEALGKSAGEVIRDRVLIEAKRLLVNADESISEIAYQLNFIDNSYFTKFFKKYTGITPETFKKQFDTKK